MRTLCICLAMVLAGCSQLAPEQVTVAVKGDTYCDLSRKISWSQNDTAETVRQIVVHNAKIDRVCGIKST